jgi:hypothetical protein
MIHLIAHADFENGKHFGTDATFQDMGAKCAGRNTKKGENTTENEKYFYHAPPIRPEQQTHQS